MTIGHIHTLLYGGLGYGYGYFGDPTILLMLAAMLISGLVSANMKSAFSRYSKVRSAGGMTGQEVARRLLGAKGLYDVQIEHVSGSLTDHYDPSSKVLRLSDSVYGSTSVAALGVAAHECGHAVQHAESYAPLSIRTAIVPVANFSSKLAWPLFFIGLLASIQPLLTAGIILFCGAIVFQVVTLPVEFNASGRALAMLRDTGVMGEEEVKDTKKVLRAAALTYVAAVVGSLLQLIRLLLIRNNRRD